MTCDYRPATFKHRLTIQTASRIPDGQGGFTESWVDGDTVSASLKPTKGYERFQAQQMQSPVSHDIAMRYRPGITTENRLVLGSRIFHIKEVLNENEENRYLLIKALEA